jgi:hypothetical protein
LEDDAELKLITARKMAALRKRAEIASAPKPQAKTSKQIVLDRLYDRGDEVLETAYSRYPRDTAIVVEHLAGYLSKHPEAEKISGGELLQIFRSLGLRFSLKTSIKVQEKGRFVDLKDKFKLEKEED